MAHRPCHAVDLDGTLAVYDGWRGHLHIGEPIPLMVERVRAWLKEGHDVVIFTARASQPERPEHAEIIREIEGWCRTHLGQRLEVTAVKSHRFVDFWDDRAVGVVKNSGMCA